MNRNAAPSLATGRKRGIVAETEPEFKITYMNSVKIYTPKGIDLYPVQKKMINWVIKAAQESKNALIESPTGSGKTLALLASVCSWLTKYEDQRRNKVPCPVHGINFTETIGEDALNETETSVLPVDASMSEFADEMSAEKSPKLDSDINHTGNPVKSVEKSCTCMQKVRIYYCTRTHKQIYQVVNEYKRLPFAQMGTLKHTILASREQSCINDDVRGIKGDLNTNCKKTLEPKAKGCTYRENLKTMTAGRERSTIRKKLLEKDANVWNIDELVDLCKTNLNICPYFLTNRELTKDANLIFCPFNYLLDPIVREASDINLKNSIIILDEAHNIEDVGRSTASFEFTDLDFAVALQSMDSKLNQMDRQAGLLRNSRDGQVADTLCFVEDYSNSMRKWHNYLNQLYLKFAALSSEAENMTPDRYNNTRTMNIDSDRLTNWLSDIYLAEDSDEYSSHWQAYNQLIMKNDPTDNNFVDFLVKANLQLGAGTIVLMEKLLFFFKFHSRADNRSFYKGNVEIGPAKSQNFEQSQSSTELPKGLLFGHTVRLSFWSMLPAVAFNDAFSQCRSIILASGTLCPLDTFCGELGVRFEYRMEGQQIIPKERIFCTALKNGPSNKNLRLTFANMNNAFPDLTLIILDVCNICPGGVLVFVSSYRVLQQLRETFNKVGNYKKLLAVKEVFYEPKDSRDMADILKEYEKAIARPKKQCTGAVMFAVFRGKVSEGLNFEDDKARAVISIGIPYPSVADQQVQQKKMFNDQNSKNHNLLCGAEWYEIQAFRAINQALGRCLRHKNDWGALIMVDERYTPTQTKISGWVRSQMRTGLNYKQFCNSLNEFVQYHVNNPVEKLQTQAIDEDYDW